jgi:hypothetical protein
MAGRMLRYCPMLCFALLAGLAAIPSVAHAADGAVPVYRFYNTRVGSHFYTISADERDQVIARWPTIYTYEGVAYSVPSDPTTQTTPVYRFYNRRAGSHFYTISADERDQVIARWPAIYTYEGVAYSVPSDPTTQTTPVYRFYNRRAGSHFYTISADERDQVIARWPTIYTYEGVAYSVPSTAPWTVVPGYGPEVAALINPAATYDPLLEAQATVWALYLAQHWDEIPTDQGSRPFHSGWVPESVGQETGFTDGPLRGIPVESWAARHSGHNPQLTTCSRLGVAFVSCGTHIYTVAQGADYVPPPAP